MMSRQSVKLKMNFIYLPTPSSLSYFWNFGSLLGMSLMIQIISGLFLSIHYSAFSFYAFDSIVHVMEDVNHGWIIRFVHANGASLFFFFLFFHIGRGLYFQSYKMKTTWLVGVIMVFLFMATAFLGYVLPWGQMSYWGGTVITNLISAIPYIGVPVVEWLWGGFSVNGPTLMRFYSLHFILPFLGAVLAMVHIFSLHLTGSGNPLGLSMDSDKISFYPYFWIKDVVGFFFSFFFFLLLSILFPYMFMDCDNFIEKNPLVTPAHIQPEWYFLFAYAILRSVPSKLGGVLMLVLSILVLLFPVIMKVKEQKAYHKFLCFCLYAVFLLLSWVGSLPVEAPYLIVGQILSVIYFIIMMMIFY